MIELGYTQILLSLLMIAIALGVTFWWRIPVQKDMAWGSVRAFVQLIAVGYALKFIFDLKSLWLIFGAILIMITVGAYTATNKVKFLKGAFLITFSAIAAGSTVTLGLMLLLGIVTLDAQYVIPLAGMIVGNSMNAAALTTNRIGSDLKQNTLAIETSLALGYTWREASRPYQREAATAGMISMLNFLKTVGIVALPGAMTGMILAGAEPLQAVLLQFIVGAMLLCAVSITSILALELTVRKFFTSQHQLIRPS